MYRAALSFFGDQMKIAGHYEGCLELQAWLKTKVCHCQAHEVVKQEEARHAACNEQIEALQGRLEEACHVIDNLERLVLKLTGDTDVQPGSVIGLVLEELAVFRG